MNLPNARSPGAASTATSTVAATSVAAPLAGIRVIDFSHFVAGPFAAMQLADLGAEVIKVENPVRGDEFRHYPPYDERLAGEGAPFLWTNRNKKGVAIDLKSPEGLRVVKALIQQADVVIENFSSGVMERLGLSYAACSADNPKLVYCSVSAYGREGAFADRLGFDPVVQAESGFISMNGYADRQGVRTGPSTMDIGTAMLASNAILAALFERSRSGHGQQLEVSLFEGAVTMLGFAAMQSLFNEITPGRHGNSSPDTAPTGVFHASDGDIYIACTSTPIYQRLFTAIGREDLAHDATLATKAARLEHRDQLFEVLNSALSKDTRENWQAKFRAARIPAGSVRTVPEALHSPESQARGIVSRIPHPTAGSIPNVASAIRLKRTPVVAPRAAPILGQHTDEVLRDVLGYDDARLHELARSGGLGEARRSAGAAQKESGHA
ncbi:MAG: CaiB/BaiF CoA transferase family protein [Janthinobacterium lividum]